MKQLLITFLIFMYSITSMAQTEHMTFKGVPIDGQLNAFVSALEKQGYTKKLQNDDGAILKGDFAGKSDCTIFVVATKVSKTVWKVAIKFPEKASWYSLKDEYKTFRESYTNKYGKPVTYEFFSDPYYEGDGYELQALRKKKCTYVSFFTSSRGNIALEMTDDSCVQVGYEDGINVEIFKREKNQVVLEDI